MLGLKLNHVSKRGPRKQRGWSASLDSFPFEIKYNKHAFIEYVWKRKFTQHLRFRRHWWNIFTIQTTAAFKCYAFFIRVTVYGGLSISSVGDGIGIMPYGHQRRFKQFSLINKMKCITGINKTYIRRSVEYSIIFNTFYLYVLVLRSSCHVTVFIF